MLNTDIFKFEFVDRYKEREILDDFFSGNLDNTCYALWLHGKRGTGKTYLLTEYVMNKDIFTSVYVNIELENAGPGDYLKKFINQLNKAANLKFISYIRANYKSIAAIGQKALNTVLNLTELDDIGLDELSSSITNYFISKQGEKENTVSVIKKYVVEALKKCERLVFMLDNFSQCDSTSLDVIVSVIHELITTKDLRFIICTTDDDLENRFDIKRVLAEKIPNKQLIVKPFQEKYLFVRMLERSFDLNESAVKLLSHTFELCDGLPQRFKEILINLYASDGISIDGKKAQFVFDVFNQQLIKKELSFDIETLCRKYKAAKLILQIIAYWGSPISNSILEDFIRFFIDIDPYSFVDDDINITLHTLEDLHVITRLYEDQMILLQFEHDSLKLAVVKYFQDDRSIPFLHYSIYEYLMRQTNISKSLYWSRYYQALLAYHSFAAKTDGWIEYNYAYANSFFESNRYSEAESVFSRLETVVTALTGKQLLTMGITFFYCGQYSKADDILSNIQARNLIGDFSLTDSVQLYVFQARARLCILDSAKALEAINYAEMLDVPSENLRILILGTKQSILFLSPEGFEKAKLIFDELVKENHDIPEMILIYQSAMDYYEGNKALKYLNKGLELSKKFSNTIAEGKIQNNIGFELLRCGKYKEAEHHFKESISLLKECQPHEQVYPYSNLAVLHMIFKDWDKALSYIVEALFWNKSHYASLVLKTNRMLCYYFMGNPQWKQIFDKLYEYISLSNTVDDKIYKKICINMALLALNNNWISEGKKILDLCYPHMKLEWPHGKYRFFNLYHKITGEDVELVLPSDSIYEKYYCKIEFEPWLINFSHD